MKNNKKKIWFIAGTDTNVGKTIISSYILKIGINKGYNTIGYKPVASGSIRTALGVQNLDVITLKKYSTIKMSDKVINPFFFKHEGPPHILSHKRKEKISMHIMSERLDLIRSKSNWIVIEGAGGLYTPLSNTDTFSNWVKKENLPIILVIGIKLGCINHAITTKNSISKDNLFLFGWIANHISPLNQYSKEYIVTLKKYLGNNFLGEIPYNLNMKYSYHNNINIY